MQINIEIPDTFALAIGGDNVTFRAEDIPTETWSHFMSAGMARVASYTYSSPKAAARKAFEETNPGKTFTWLPTDHDKLRDDVVRKIKEGDWGRAASGGITLDPVGKIAHDLAKAKLMAEWVKLTGEKTIKKIYAMRESAREFFNESDGVYRWNESRVAAFIDEFDAKLHFRADAEARHKMLNESEIDLGL